MACVRFRRGKWVVDFRDQWGKRKWLAYPGTPEGETAAKAECERIKLHGAPAINPGITLGDYITEHWLPVLRKRVDPRTAAGYELNARVHISAALKKTRPAEITYTHLTLPT